MDSQREVLSLKAANEKAIHPAGNPKTSGKIHVTAKGREGRALRKKLAIAMGLRVSSSGTPSTVDSEEELEEETSQNVLEMFRKQMKMTAAQRKRSPKSNSKQQQVADDASSLLFKRTVHRKTTTRTDYVDDEDDFSDEMDYQERSRDHFESSSDSRRSHDRVITQSKLSKSQEDAKNNSNKRLTTQQDSTTQQQTITHGNTSADLEETFSSFGEQNELSSATRVSSGDSVKLLREKIRKNARARKLPRPGGVRDGKETIHTEKGIESQRKLSGSQIPVRVARKTSDELIVNQNEDLKENSIQKSKIPRRKSQNAADRKDTSKKSDSKVDSLLTEIFSTDENERKSTEKLKVNMRETAQSKGSINQDIVTAHESQELHSNYSNLNTLFDGGVSTAKEFKQEKNKSTSGFNVKNILKELRTKDKSVQGTNQNISSNVSKRDHSHQKTTYDFDTLLFEIEKLKVSVYKTYDDFHEMNEFTLGLRKELKKCRNI